MDTVDKRDTRERIAKLKSPRVREVLTAFVDEFIENLFIPNSLLPKSLQGKKPHVIDGKKVYGQLFSKPPEENKLQRKQREDAERRATMERNLSAYESQTVTDGCYNGNPVEFVVDDDKLYRNQVVFMDLLIKSGAVDAEDLEE